MKETIYIAGPMRGYQMNNHIHFNRAASYLRAAGWYVLNPAEISADFGTQEQLNADKRLLALLMEFELSLLETCQAIYLIRGWENSEGARAELAKALKLGLRIYLEPF